MIEGTDLREVIHYLLRHLLLIILNVLILTEVWNQVHELRDDGIDLREAIAGDAMTRTSTADETVSTIRLTTAGMASTPVDTLDGCVEVSFSEVCATACVPVLIIFGEAWMS